MAGIKSVELSQGCDLNLNLSGCPTSRYTGGSVYSLLQSVPSQLRNQWMILSFPHSSSLVGATALGSSSHTIGNAAINAIITVAAAQDGEELTILPNAVPGIKEPVGHRQLWQVRAPSEIFLL